MKRAIGLFLMLSISSLDAIPAAQDSWVRVGGGQWTVEESTVIAMQSKIENYVVRHAKAQHRQLQTWSEYTFQYQGRLSKSARYIYINAFCEKTELEDIRSSFVEVNDGGTCYFRLRFDPKIEHFSQLIFNGEA